MVILLQLWMKSNWQKRAEVFIPVDNFIAIAILMAVLIRKTKLLCFRHLSESRFCLALYTEEINLQTFVMI